MYRPGRRTNASTTDLSARPGRAVKTRRLAAGENRDTEREPEALIAAVGLAGVLVMVLIAIGMILLGWRP